MTSPTIVVFTDEEMNRWTAVDEEPGFGALLTDRGPLPLKALDVQARLEGLIGEIELTQTFVNTHAEPVEATYIFPLPDRAAVMRFRLEVAGRVVEGVLKERGAARREYDQAMQAGHRAAIAEEERPNVFTLRVGNLPAGETATVRLALVGPLIYDAGEVTFRFPLVVAPRYIPGTPLSGRSVGDGIAVDTDAVPDASRISPPVFLPGYPYPVRFSLTVEILGGQGTVQDLASSLHAVNVDDAAAAVTRIRVQPGERLNRDFILRYRLAGTTIQTALTLVPDAGAARDGTFVLTIVPPLQAVKTHKPRDVVFVLDRSGSMSGWKMVAARRALGRMVDALTERDRFSVVAFDDHVEMPPAAGDGLLEATDRQRFRTLEWLAKVDARGGTEMAQPLDWAVQQLSSDRDRVLVLVTDGQVGNEDQILALLGQRLRGIRIFTLGIDRAVNEGFLQRLAALGGGSCDIVESEDRLDEVMGKVQRRIGNPLLTALRLEATGLSVDAAAQVPARLPDLFPGVPLQIMGRYHGAPEGVVQLRATDEAGRPMMQTVVGRASRLPAASALWARARLRELEDRWVVGDKEVPAELEKKMVAISLKYGVLCRFTAYVAVDRSAVVNEGGQQQRLVQPAEAVEGWQYAVGGSMPVARCASPAAYAATPVLPMAQSAPTDSYASLNISLDLEAPPSARARRLQDAMTMDGECTGADEDQISESCDFEAAVGDAPEGEHVKEASPAADRTKKDAEPGLLRKVFGNVFSKPQSKLKQRKATSMPPRKPANAVVDSDLTAYRHRARLLLTELRSDADLSHGLGVLALQLKALVEDLRSTGATAAVVAPLEQLLAALDQLLRGRTIRQDEAVALAEQAAGLLEKFAAEPVTA